MRTRCRHIVTFAVVAALGSAGLAACTDDDDTASATTTTTTTAVAPGASGVSDREAPGLLYVQRAGSGTAATGTSGEVELTLVDVDADTVWFQDRPGRDAGRLGTGAFVDDWAANGFAEDPPNATLEVVVDGGGRSTHVVELRDPRWDDTARTLAYTATPADDGGGPPPGQFAAASLFIDDAAGDSFQPIRLSVSNAQPGQQVVVQLRSAGATPVSFSSGPGSGSASGIQLSSPSGGVTVTDLQITPSTIELQTSAGSGGAALDWTMSLFLVAGTGLDDFYLSSGSDPGVEITAAIGNTEPQVVNQTETLFSWQ